MLRVDSRVLSGKTGFAQAYALTGPPSGGKSFMCLRLLRLLGQDHDNLCTPLPAVFFTVPPRQDPNGSQPVTASCAGSRLVVPKESPSKPIVPESLKGILDPRDVNVSARQNNSQKTDDVSFGVSWVIIIQSQNPLHLKEDEKDGGVVDKILEFQPPFEFVAPKLFETTNNPRHRKADKGLMDLCDDGQLSAELVYFALRFYDTLDNEICAHRTLAPMPPNSKRIQVAASSNSLVDQVRVWISKHLDYSDSKKDASRTSAVHTAMKLTLGKVDAATRTQAGLGPVPAQYRAGPKSEWHDLYETVLPWDTGKDKKPVKLRDVPFTIDELKAKNPAWAAEIAAME